VALEKCRFKPAVKDGETVGGWVPVAYTWVLTDDEDMKVPKRGAAQAAARGDLAARYHLTLLLQKTAKTDAERERAMVVLRSAAELGLAQAQYDLGRRYEKGDGVTANVEEALRWYEKSAARNNVLAVQRLKLGALSDQVLAAVMPGPPSTGSPTPAHPGPRSTCTAPA
jgi:hypothetical protein